MTEKRSNRIGVSLILLTVGAVSSFACDKSADRLAQESREQAAVEAKNAGQTGTVGRVGPGAAEAFAKTRDEYQTATQKQLNDLDRSIDDLQAKADKATGTAKQQLETAAAKARQSRDEVRKNLQGANTIAEATWSSFKENIDKGVTAARRTVEDAAKTE